MQMVAARGGILMQSKEPLKSIKATYRKHLEAAFKENPKDFAHWIISTAKEIATSPYYSPTARANAIRGFFMAYDEMLKERLL